MEDRFTGAQVGIWRRRRGMTQQQLADLVDVSQGYISQIESGLRTIERRSLLLAIAEALNIPASELVSPSEHVGPSYAQAHAAIPKLRIAIAELQAGGRGQLRRTEEQLRNAMDAIDRRILTSDWAGTIPYLPDVVLDASAIGGATYARAMEQAVSPPLALGYKDLSWLIADFALRIAREAEQWAWVGASACSLTFALPVEVRSTARIAQTVADEIQPYAADPNVRQVYGELHLAAALSEAVAKQPGRAADRLAEAEQMAATLGDPEHGAGFAQKGFGPSCVTQWRMNVANELGEPDLVPALASQIDPKVFAGPSLRCFYWLHRARAEAELGRDMDALASLVRSEQASAQIFIHHRGARDMVVTLVRRERRRSLPGPLVRLARVVGAETHHNE